MSEASLPLRLSGIAIVAGAICYLPLGLLAGWQSIADIGSQTWWFVQTLASAHHIFLTFGLFGIYAAVLPRPGASGLGAFVLAGTGNALLTGVGAIQLTVLPALAAHPTASSGLDCTPFYQAATASAAALIAAACEPWHFAALNAWVSVAWITLMAGSIWIAVELWRGGRVARTAGILLGIGWLVQLASIAAPLPAGVSRMAYLLIAVSYLWIGAAIIRRPAR